MGRPKPYIRTVALNFTKPNVGGLFLNPGDELMKGLLTLDIYHGDPLPRLLIIQYTTLKQSQQ